MCLKPIATFLATVVYRYGTLYIGIKKSGIYKFLFLTN